MLTGPSDQQWIRLTARRHLALIRLLAFAIFLFVVFLDQTFFEVLCLLGQRHGFWRGVGCRLVCHLLVGRLLFSAVLRDILKIFDFFSTGRNRTF